MVCLTFQQVKGQSNPRKVRVVLPVTNVTIPDTFAFQNYQESIDVINEYFRRNYLKRATVDHGAYSRSDHAQHIEYWRKMADHGLITALQLSATTILLC